MIRRAFGLGDEEESPAARESLLAMARRSGDPYKEAEYFAFAERFMDQSWQELIWPIIQGCDFHRVVDLAAGHGRNGVKLREVADHVVVVDINEECLEACRRRFAGDPRFTFLRTDGVSLAGIADASVTLVYSFDSMVHFEREVVREYLAETRRVLVPGGHGFFHHSNYTGNGGGDFRQSPHWRNHMSRELFGEHAQAVGLEVVQSRVIDWGPPSDFHRALDCVSLVRRPAATA